jgi:hypothetical protein
MEMVDGSLIREKKDLDDIPMLEGRAPAAHQLVDQARIGRRSFHDPEGARDSDLLTEPFRLVEHSLKGRNGLPVIQNGGRVEILAAHVELRAHETAM